uniref:lipid-A-disaccharide synthase n=1 Tax=Strombidium inclinatum TaxID=197538 RepID=A0A7S3MRE3_9SPIT|mmetsp:Transcript_11767/g.18043  ORF Transcript_11767/g.18043 Transcript_11767/m.18043 type:complete len:389 (+) Transcript_11767:396-1562(+)
MSIGNEYLSLEVLESLKPFYEKTALPMPKRHLHTRFARDFKEYYLPKVDFAHYTIPNMVDFQNGFRFPGEYVGQYGVYDAVSHVYSKNESLKHLLKDDYLLTNQKYFATDMERGVQAIRSNWRAQHNISPDAFTVFVAPGNEKNEVEFCFENLRRGIKEFLLKYSSPTSLSPKALPLEDNFVTVISVHSGTQGEAAVKALLKEREWTGRVIIVNEQDNAHYDAMAGSDFGFVYDGQMVSSANALNLPVNCMIYMRMHHQWWHDFYNRWWNDMNILADGRINQELIGGEVWFGKIAEQLASFYIRPQGRVEAIQKAKGFIQEGMSYKPLNRADVRTKDLILQDGDKYDQHYDPFQLSARILLNDMEAYDAPFGQSESGLKAQQLQIPSL